MLPFTKRPARRANETSNAEVISTGDFEVVQGNPAKPSSRFPAPTSNRPRVFQRSSSEDEDRTLLMPSKMRSTIAPPRPSSAPPAPSPASIRPIPAPSLKGLVRQRMDSEERTMLRPMSPIPPPMTPPRAATASPAMMPTPYMPFKPPSAPPPAKKPSAPPPINAKGGSDVKKTPGDSDARLEVPAAVITQRTRIIPRKPSVSWAAALVALGVFTGLVTAVVARGDADSLLDATASLVDPTAARPAAAAPGAAQLPAAVALPANNAASPLPPGAATACGTDAPATPQPIAHAPVVNTPPVSAATPTPTTAKPEAPKPPPVAWAAPRAYAPPAAAQPAAPKPVAAPAPQPQAVAAAPKPAPAAPKAGPAPKGGGSEMESAAAADALAKAQLEASLR